MPRLVTHHARRYKIIIHHPDSRRYLASNPLTDEPENDCKCEDDTEHNKQLHACARNCRRNVM